MEYSKSYKIEILTPLCVASNEKYKEPEFIIDSDSKKVKFLNIEKMIAEKPEIVDDLFIQHMSNMKRKDTFYVNTQPQFIKYALDFYNSYDFSDEIYGFVKTTGKVYIPGSSLKGAFILSFLKNKDNANLYLRNLQGKEIFKYKYVEKINRETEKDILGEPNINLFKFLSFTDSNLLHCENNLKIASVKVFSINEKNTQFIIQWFAGVTKGKEGQRYAKYFMYPKEGKSILVETLVPKTVVYGKYKFILPTQVVQNFGDYFPWVKKQNFTSFSNILQQIRKNIARRIESEINFIAQIKNKLSGDLSIINSYLRHFENLKTMNQNLKDNEIILQMGLLTGFISKTLIDHDIELPVYIKKLRYKDYRIFPKTRRIIINNNNVETLGWIKVTFD
ncbi:MAG: type III-A CRISPR-associated RAMP protein Csm5 [bacterium]|nr:type III-A CRISPR-associated RAMP protein Csm5 [bacterium]